MKSPIITLLTVVLFVLAPSVLFSQQDCNKFLSTLQPDYPYKINSMSKGALCITGHTYEFNIPLKAGNEYRLVFYASTVFDNDIHFRIFDLSKSETDPIIDVPGKVPEGELPEKGQTALQPYFDETLNREVHPFFSIIPQSSTTVKIVIDVKQKPELIKGCVTVVLLERPFDEGSFK